MPATRPTYELRVYADPVALPYGSSTISRHRSAQAALNAYEYGKRQTPRQASAPRAIIEVWPDGREYVADDHYTVLERHR